MNVTLQAQNPRVIALTLMLLLLACGPLNRLQELNRKGRVLATGVAIMGEGNYQAFDAYDSLNKLPSYRLESRTILRDSRGNRSTITIISEHDSQGNVYTLTQTADGRQHEIYVVDGHTYVFEPEYEGWVDLGTTEPAQTQLLSGNLPAELKQFINPVQFVSKLGAVPTAAGNEFIYNRSATRYELEYVAAKLTETFGDQQHGSTTDLQGTIWVDDQTGALLRSELLVYEHEARQPNQEYFLETSRIGSVGLIALPSPVVNPATMISATATAQAWSVLQARLNYQGTLIDFEMVPLQISQVTGKAPPSATMQLALRQLPSNFSLETEARPFLTQLDQQLTVSIPKHNLVVASSGFQVEQINPQDRSIEVVYFFDVDLEDFAHVELILSGQGNPIIAAVPVADDR